MCPEKEASFERVAHFYEVLANAEKRLQRESGLLRGVLQQAPGHRVLDLACGTGVHALWFAREGAEVTATDLSDGMIAYARKQRPHARIDYCVSDMRTPPEGVWDLAVSMGNSLSLLVTEDDLSQVFERVSARLGPGGLFFFQVLNYSRPEAQRPRHRIEEATLPEGRLTAIKNLVPVGEFTLLALNFFVEEGGGRFQSNVDTAVLRHWTKEDLIAVAGESALAPVDFWGGFDGEGFDPSNSADLIALFKKG